MRIRQNIFALCAIAGLAAHASACTFFNAFVSSGPGPRVEDCALIQQAAGHAVEMGMRRQGLHFRSTCRGEDRQQRREIGHRHTCGCDSLTTAV
jgi:hypothetical protein